MDIVHHFKLSFDENETGIAFDQVEVFFVQILFLSIQFNSLYLYPERCSMSTFFACRKILEL